MVVEQSLNLRSVEEVTLHVTSSVPTAVHTARYAAAAPTMGMNL